ncbi:MAG: aminotransferase class I/II-fold pyridoxal phosphate-dependent enzyme [Castellaniella sp.]|uniref:methionine aminotransferase n=1 Tax=Castellaniella sp. TaxID=1955812 RepID=UPI001225F368|nr:methionine aminotransferase [Castellaniella sp.]TAN29501.1 MAG: aminotransferase class I/II-fold pyridoxal phosphate-dependent enzyme [Castellaniella sp.]
MNLQSKLPNVGITIFTEMSALAKQQHAINLGQGFPDYQPDANLLQAVTDAMLAGHNQYAPMAGMPILLEAIANKVQAQHGRHYDPTTEITVTAGATEALMASIQALVKQGDEVILIDPAYDLYAPAVILSGGRNVRVPMLPPTADRLEFAVDWDAIHAAATDRTRMIILNFPHNPTGLILKDSDLDELEHLIDRHPQIVVLSDEAYEHIVFDEEEQRSAIRREALVEHSVLISSFGKTFHATGWKIGYCCAPESIMQEIRRVHQFLVFSVNTPMQVGIANYLQHSNVISTLSAFYQKKRDRLLKGLATTCLKPMHSAGTFFLLVDTSALGTGPEKDLAVRLTLDVGVTTIPVSAFYDDANAAASNHNLLRLCFAKQDSTLDRAVEKLQTLK